MNEPKDWYRNTIRKWSVRIESRIYHFYDFDAAFEFAVLFKSENTIQYKDGK